jgi:hypothetical protein
MAWAFNKGDLGDIAAIAGVHPTPRLWWVTVRDNNSDGDLNALAVEIIAQIDAGQPQLLALMEDVIEELRRIADIDTELEIVRSTETEDGRLDVVQAKTRGLL